MAVVYRWRHRSARDAIRQDLPKVMWDWRGYQECHIRHDLLLIYRRRDACTLELVRMGPHGELFG
jgi:addiction module RelE/StbE family toxin